MTTNVEILIQEIQRLPLPDREQVLAAIIQSLQTETAARDLTELIAQYPNEWLAIIIPDGEDRYQPQRGCLVAHHPDHSLLWQQINKSPTDDIYVFFNGPVAAKGFGLIFHDATDTPEVATLVS